VQEALARVLQERRHQAGKDAQHKQQQQQQGKKQQKKGGAPREFDFSRFGTRHIALQLSYEGDRYLGFATRVSHEMK
jgi:hypothetical protein